MSYVLIVILICFSAFFSGTEIAYTSVNRVRLKKLAEDGSRMAKLADKISDKFDDALTAVLVGNNFVNIAASATSTTIALSIAKHMGNGHGSTGLAATIATVVITILILIFGEIVPKVVCKQNSDRAACLTAYPLAFFIILFYPITFLVGQLLKLCSHFWGKPDDSVSEEELAMLIETTEEDGGIDEDKSDLLQSALEFSDITLAEVITHRTEVLALDVDANPAENLRIINSSRHSRLPVYKDSIDNIIGILNINQFYKRLAENPETVVKDVMFEPLMMHGTVKLPVALEEMREMQMPMTVVLDEYGGTLGIATTEDILEQIVGDIWDESDEIVEEIISMLWTTSSKVSIFVLTLSRTLLLHSVWNHTICLTKWTLTTATLNPTATRSAAGVPRCSGRIPRSAWRSTTKICMWRSPARTRPAWRRSA